MAANPRSSNGAARRALRRRVAAMGRPCWICGLPIDYSLPGGHPLSYELDEVIPVSKGGSPIDPENVAPAHRCCNQWRSDKDADRVRAVREAVRSRWGSWRTPMQFIAMAKAVIKGLARRIPRPGGLDTSRRW